MSAGTLFVVATPIGNLEDLTARALRVLREADLIAAEDTRRTSHLLARHAISVPLLSFHEHNSRARVPQLIERLEEGAKIALVSDAGTPGLADPGLDLIRACIERQIAIDPIPGASAPLTAVVASGFPVTPLTVWGFAPPRPKDRRAWFSEICATLHTFTFFEAPHRIAAALEDLGEVLGDRPIVVARELTKVHQEFLRGTAQEIASRLSDVAKGEFTVVVGPSIRKEPVQVALTDAEIAEEFRRLTDSAATSRRETIAALARRFGRSPREVYAAVERAKKSAERPISN